MELVARQPQALDHGLYVNASSASALAKDLRAILSAHGQPTENLGDGFVELVSGPNAPPYVIVDNVEDPRLIKDLLSSDSRSTMVVTANRQIPEYKHSSLEVTPMTGSEAEDLIQNLLPGIAEGQAEQVAQALGYRPLAIVHACGFILGDGLVKVEHFLANLRSDAAQVMRVPAVADELTLTTIYELTLQHLGHLQDDSKARVLARNLLELVACVAPDDIPPDLLLDGMRNATTDGVSSTKFQEAVLALRARFLVRVVNGRLAIHPLTQMILRALLRPKEQELCLALHGSVQRLLRDQDRSKPVGQDIIDAVPHFTKLALGLQGVDVATFRGIGLDHTLAVILRASRQIGLKRPAFRTVIDDAFDTIYDKIYASVYENDPPNWVAYDDVRELTCEMIPFGYSAGAFTEQIYLSQVLQILDVGYDLEAIEYSQLSIGDLNDLATATLPCSCISAFTMLSSQAERARREADGPVQYGDFKALQGEVLLTAAAWDDAWDALHEALRAYEQAEDDLLAIRGTARVLKMLGDWALHSGRVHKIPTLTATAESFIEKREDIFEQDVLTTAYIQHYFARQLTAEYLDKEVPIRLITTGVSDVVVGEELYRRASQDFGLSVEATRAVNAAVDEYQLGGYAREAHELSYDGMLTWLLRLHGRLDPKLCVWYQPREQFAENPLLIVRFELAKFKVATLHGHGAEADWDATLLSFSSNFEALEKCGAAYWYAECLAAICILSAQCGLSDYKDMFEYLQELYTCIGRPERSAHVLGSIHAWQKGDRREFIRRFAPLVSF